MMKFERTPKGDQISSKIDSFYEDGTFRSALKFSLSGILCWIYCVSIVAQGGSAIEKIVENYVADPDLRTAKISVVIQDLQNETTLADHNPSMIVSPASTLKVITTAAALKTLGADYRFETELSYTGQIVGSVLEGNVVITGGGDPSLGSGYLGTQAFEELLQEWVGATRSLGISEIKGQILADASLFGREGVPPSWATKDVGNYYAAGSYGLNVHDNLYFLRFQQGLKQGDATKVAAIEPTVPNFFMENRVITGAPGSGDQAYIFGSAFQPDAYVEGTIPPGASIFTIKGSLPDPAAFLVHHFRSALQEGGITSDQEGITHYNLYRPETSLVFHTTHSPPLTELVTITNRESVNLYAECMGKKMSHDIPEFSLQGFWQQAGVEARVLSNADFSGLSQQNQVSGRFMTDALQRIYQDPEWYAAVRTSLSRGGIDGTLKNMFKSSTTKGRVYAKSGLINGVRCYIGYLDMPGDEVYGFAVLAQGFSCSSREMSRKFERLIEAVLQQK